MANLLLEALSGEGIVESNSLATVTETCVLIRGATGRSQTLISRSRLSDVKIVKINHPSLLVISSGLGLVSAAAFCSKQGDGAGPPTAFIALTFLIAYFVTRKAFLTFTVGLEETYSSAGTLSEAFAVMKALRSAQKAEEEQPNLAMVS